MSLMNLEVIDVISIDLMGNVVLTISDDLMWNDDNEHLFALQSKINAYLVFIESGNIYQDYPNAKGRNIVINIVAKYEPNDNARIFLDKTKQILQAAGYSFKFSVLIEKRTP
jgi:hypothetical protein